MTGWVLDLLTPPKVSILILAAQAFRNDKILGGFFRNFRRLLKRKRITHVFHHIFDYNSLALLYCLQRKLLSPQL